MRTKCTWNQRIGCRVRLLWVFLATGLLAPPGIAQDPEVDCHQAAEDFRAACLDQGVNPQDCEIKAKDIEAQCLGNGVAQDPTDCNAVADEFATHCTELGLDAAACDKTRSEILAKCDAGGGKVFPGLDCETSCQASAADYVKGCKLNGGTDEECQAMAQGYLEECVKGCKAVPCLESCKMRVDVALKECVGGGRDPDECLAEVDALLEACYAECGLDLPDPNEVPDDPGFPVCGDKCAEDAVRLLAECARKGDDPAVCQKQADAFLQSCLVQCGVEPPVTCQGGCGQRASQLLDDCMKAGITPEECKVRSNDFLQNCVASCEGEPTLPPTCDESCSGIAHFYEAECNSRGGDPGQCKSEAALVLKDCVASCVQGPQPGQSPCDGNCQSDAQAVKEGCVAKGLEAAECDKIAADYLTACQTFMEEVCKDQAERLAGAGGSHSMFLRGDSNRDNRVDISDAARVLGQLFLGSPATTCEDAADANDDGVINLTDAVVILDHLFRGGQSLPLPAGELGQDPTSDGLLCEE